MSDRSADPAGNGREALDTGEPDASGAGLATGAASLGGGAALVAGAAGACCVPVLAPTLVALLGAGGAAWAAGVEPYSPYLLAGSAVLLAYSFRRLYGAGRVRVGALEPGPTRRKARLARGVVWGAAVLWVAAAAVHLFSSGAT